MSVDELYCYLVMFAVSMRLLTTIFAQVRGLFSQKRDVRDGYATDRYFSATILIYILPVKILIQASY